MSKGINKLHKLLVTLIVFLIVLTYTRAQDASLVVTSTGPVTLGTPIYFNATYNGFNEKDDIKYEWNDDLSFQQTLQAKSPHSEWILNYNRESYLYSTGTRRVTVTVMKNNVQVATAYVEFELNDYLNGQLLIEKHGNQTNLTALIHDPNDWIKWRSKEMIFSWLINRKIIAICQTPSLLINITEPGDYNIQANVYLELVDHVITSNATTKKPQAPTYRKWKCGGWWPNSDVNVATEKRPEVKVGYFVTKTTVSLDTKPQLLCYIIPILCILIILSFACLLVSKIKSLNLIGYFQKKVKHYLQLCRDRKDLTSNSSHLTKVPLGDAESNIPLNISK